MSSATDGPRHVTNRFVPNANLQIVSLPEPAVSDSKAPKNFFTVRNAIIAAIVLGVVLRAIPMLQNRCLWIDEAMLALNLVDRTPAQLLQPLDWNQGAPAGFLLIVKAVISVFGNSEWSLRLFPFAGSVLGMLAFVWLSRKLLPDRAALLATILFSISPTLISYTAECKQYVTDAAIAVGLLAAACDLLYGSTGAKRWAVLGVAGATAVWFSHPSVFVLASIGLALLGDCFVVKDRRRFLACSITIGTWLFSFAICYLTTLRHLGTNQYLLDYWAGHFLPLPPISPSDVSWVLSHFSNFVEFPGGLGGTDIKAGGLAAGLCVIGLVAFLRDRWTVAFSFLAPALFALLASGVHKYPFAGRLLLFLVPLLILATARGAWAVAAALRPSLPFASFVVIGTLLVAPAIETYQQLRRPLRYEQLTAVMEDVRKEWQPGDKVYLYYGAVPAYTFYTREKPFVPDVTLGTEYRGCRTGYRDELRKLAGEPRVWVIFSHRHQAEESLLRAYAEGLGECRRELAEPGATAFLYDFSGKH